jgi:hypothetical protein
MSVQVTVLPAPISSLHVASPLHVASDPPPAFSSQSLEPEQVMLLPSPPLPLHCDVASHVTATGPSDVALHFAPEVQATAQPAAPQVASQAVPAVQAQASPEHTQPAPVQEAVATGVPPQDAATVASASAPRMPTMM